MTPHPAANDLAQRAADHIKAEPPWDVLGERQRRFELHLQGTEVETERGPLTVEGYGVRLFLPRNGQLGVGFQASTDVSADGVATCVADARTVAKTAEFPAKKVDLPTGGGHGSEVPIVDEKLWADPLGALRAYVAELQAAMRGRSGVVVSFGSVRAILSEVSIANSSGLKASYASTSIALELAVKAFGGPEGAPPGEYWVTDSFRRLEPNLLRGAADDWCRYAADVRRAKSPPTGDLPVVLPTDVLSGILPPVLGSRLSGSMRLRKIAPEVGTVVGADSLTIRNEGDYPWANGSSPYDDEGTAKSQQPLIEHGKVTGHLYDLLHASALGARPTGTAVRSAPGPSGRLRFAHAPGTAPSTIVVHGGKGGTTAELVEAAHDGVLVTQLGWAFPDPVSGAFGGEIRIGYRIRNGKLAEPVRGGTVGGSALAPPGSPSVLASVQAIGSQATLTEGLASGAFLVRPLTVAGA